MANTSYPSLNTIVPVDQVPLNLGDFDTALEDLFKNLFYRDLQIEISSDGDAKFYKLTVVTYTSLGVDIPGTEGIKLVLNQDVNISGITAVDISLGYKLPILKYVKGLSVSGFAGDPRAIFDLLLEIADVEEEELASKALELLVGANEDSLAVLTDMYNNLYPIQVSNIETLQQFISAVEGAGEEGFEIIFRLISELTNGVAELIDSIKELFQEVLSGITFEDILTLFIPQASLSILNLNMALQFPRKHLIPIDSMPGSPTLGGALPEPAVSQLTFNVGSLEYSTQTGFHFKGENSFNFTKSMIGKSGLTIEINNMKLDLSRKTNIPEAIADGRPADFMGVYAQEAIIGLPEKWFKQENTTLGIFGRNLLIGTGGLSGKIGLETIGNTSDSELVFTLGKKPTSGAPRKGFQIGFSQFQMIWQQNALIESSVKGSLTIPKFKQYDFTTGTTIQQELRIEIEALFEQDGDFQITAKADGGLNLCIEDVMVITIDSLEVGKDDDKVFLCISGGLSFENNSILKELIKDPIEVKKLCIYSDGSFEVEGGSIPLPDSARMKFGPTEVSVTNLTFGSEERERGGALRKFKYIGFDCGVSAGNIGLDLRADGISYNFTTDNGTFDHFLKISGIGIDLIIPGSASKETAAVLIQGYLSIKEIQNPVTGEYEKEYIGSVAFQLPKAKMAGGASMRMKPKVPAWVVDAFLELAVPIPLGPSGLGIFGFRGLFGLRYIAAKEAVGLTQDDKWFNYYKKDVAPDGKGVHTGKLYDPSQNPNEVNGASTPISIGAGLSLATTADDGRAFSLQAFFLISLPNVIFIQGKANILGDRVGLTDDEPPYFAFVAFSPGHSIEFGLGADYKQRDDGKLVKINAEVEAGFFMKNSSAWYINFGTKDKPITARVLDLFNTYSYLMLSASGIEAGFRVDYEFKKKYGPVKAEVGVYLDAWGKLSFTGPQIGAGIALGGYVDVSIWGIGLGFSIATTLEATVPKPFRIAGTVEICVKVKLLVKKFKKCIDIEFVWEKDNSFENTPIPPLPSNTGSTSKGSPVTALHIGSGKTYEIDYLGHKTSRPSDASGITNIVPLDSYIDIQFEKAVDANAVSSEIGGISNAPKGNKDLIPPKPSYNRVTHSYKVKEVAIWTWDDAAGWVDYHPYEALTIGSTNTGINLSNYKVGFFQKTGKEYNKIRFLAQTPFSYVETSAGNYTPEQMGITSATLFCKDVLKKWHCAKWNELLSHQQNSWFHHEGLNYVIRNGNGQVMPFPNSFLIPNSLMIPNGAKLEIFLPENALSLKLKLFTFAANITIRYFEGDYQNGFIQYNEVSNVQKTTLDLVQAVVYEDENQPIRKISIESSTQDFDQIQQLLIEIDQLQQLIYVNDEPFNELEMVLAQKKKALIVLQEATCSGFPVDVPITEPVEEELANCTAALQACQEQIAALEIQISTQCTTCTNLEIDLSECLERIKHYLNTPDITKCLTHIQEVLGKNKLLNKTLKKLISGLNLEFQNCRKKIHADLYHLLETITNQLQECHEKCQTLRDELASAQVECEALEDKITELEIFIDNYGGYVHPSGAGKCGTFIHEICWLTEEDYYYNQTIPGQDAIEEDFQLAQSAIQHVVSPIWRPKQKYLIKVTVSDRVNNGSEETYDTYFGFETIGPIGHFPEDKIPKVAEYQGDTTGPEYGNYDTRVELPETSLKFYLDNEKSYPDPAGKILNRKPLYYKNPRILIYYNKPYVYHFFGTWDNYNGLPARSGQLEMLIKDPVEDIADALATDHTSSVFTQFPETVVSWDTDNDPIVPEDVQLYGDLRNPELNNPNYAGGSCWLSGGDPIIPASKNTEIIPKHLKPLKLYTAIVRNNFEGNSKEVHRYGFQTSRFGTLQEHIDSYHLKDKEGNTRDAVFTVDINLDRMPDSSDQVNINRAFNIVQNDPGNLNNYNKTLAETFSDPYQRLMEGHFKFKADHPSLGLEFNLIHETSKDRIIGIWINSVEPLNDPKIPFDVLRSSIKVLENGVINYNYFPLFSKDYSKVVLMNLNKNITATDLKISFSYLEWDGQQYIVNGSATTDNLIF